MSAKKSKNSSSTNLTPVIVGGVILVALLFFGALFLIQPSANEGALGGEIAVNGEQLPDLGMNFNRDCVFFENLNYCQQLEPAAKMSAPVISGTGLNGEQISTGTSNPKVILFLAHWCGHCQIEVPIVQKWIDENGNPDPIEMYAVITSISAGQPNYPPDKWLESENWTIPTFTDNEQDGVANLFGLKGFPFWALVDHHGKIITRLNGSFTAEQFETILLNTLNYDTTEHSDHHE